MPRLSCHIFIAASFFRTRLFPPLFLLSAERHPFAFFIILSYHYKIISSPSLRPAEGLAGCFLEYFLPLTTGPERNIIHYSSPPAAAAAASFSMSNFVLNFSFNKPFPSAVFLLALSSSSTFHTLTTTARRICPLSKHQAETKEPLLRSPAFFDKYAKCFEFYIKRFLYVL